jgi:hypothetical protein
MRELETILADDPKSWTDEDRNVILQAKSAHGHGYVKKLRDRIVADQSKSQPEEAPINEQNPSPAS